MGLVNRVHNQSRIAHTWTRWGTRFIITIENDLFITKGGVTIWAWFWCEDVTYPEPIKIDSRVTSDFIIITFNIWAVRYRYLIIGNHVHIVNPFQNNIIIIFPNKYCLATALKTRTMVVGKPLRLRTYDIYDIIFDQILSSFRHAMFQVAYRE